MRNTPRRFDPVLYATTKALDRIRTRDFPLLEGETYLDYTGAGQPSLQQVHSHQELLRKHIWGNPHTNSRASRTTTEEIRNAKLKILEFFHADPEEYAVVFTQNATEALKIIGESYPFTASGRLLLTQDNHNSVNGIREYAKHHGAQVTYVPLIIELRVNESILYQEFSNPGEKENLFVFPAQSNFTGVQHPLDWIESAQQSGWDVILDAAAFVPTNTLDMSVYKPEGVAISFYKMFGYPTGIGCLIAKKEFLLRLTPPSFAGGTVLIVEEDWYQLAQDPAARFENGTPNFHAILAIPIGLAFLEKIGMKTIHNRVLSLTGWLLDQLPLMHHSTGKPLVMTYGPRNLYERGGTLAFNLLDPYGTIIPLQRVEERMEEYTISLRTGCFCDPGIGWTLFLQEHHSPSPQHPFSDISAYVTQSGAIAEGAIRASLGSVSNLIDCQKLIEFLKSFIDEPPFVGEKIPRKNC